MPTLIRAGAFSRTAFNNDAFLVDVFQEDAGQSSAWQRQRLARRRAGGAEVLADLAVHDPEQFGKLAAQAKAALPQ